VAKSILIEHDLRMGPIHDRAQAELRMPGGSDLANQDEVERRPQRFGDLERHRHAAARQDQDHRILIRIGHQPRHELAPGISAVAKAEISGLHGFSLLDAGAGRTGRRPRPCLIEFVRLIEVPGPGLNRQVITAGEMSEGLLVRSGHLAVALVGASH
jgi:hypothetical protein